MVMPQANRRILAVRAVGDAIVQAFRRLRHA
jgi:hypothetical protein